jgi:hypothetical protein
MLGMPDIRELEDLVQRLEVVADDMQLAAKMTDKASKRMVKASENFRDGQDREGV